MRKERQPKIFKARVLSVDRVRCTMEILGENNQRFTMPTPATYVGGKGQGAFHMPEVNSLLYACCPSDGLTPFMVAGCTVPHEQDDDDADQDDFRQARPVLNEGDHLVASSDDGNFIILRKGGVIEVGSAQTAQRLYVPLNSLIMDVCQNYQLQTTGGVLSWETRREDETWGGGKNTPAELRLQVKEFTGEDVLIDIGLGRIQDEDDEQLMGGVEGEIVARVLINDCYRLWVDKRGNVTHYVHGESITEHNGKVVERYNQSKTQQILGMFQTRAGTRDTTVAGTDSLDCGDRNMHVRGNLTEIIDGSVSRSVKGYKDDIDGARETTVRGFEKKGVLGFLDTQVTDDVSWTVGKGYKEIVSGKRSFKVTNAQISDEAVGFEVELTQGEMHFISTLGKMRLLLGSAAVAPTEITMDLAGGITAITAVGAVTLEATTGNVTITASPSGNIDLSGLLIHLGSPLAAEPFWLGNQATSLWSALITWLDTHTHTTSMGPSSPPVVSSSLTLPSLVASCVSTKVFGE